MVSEQRGNRTETGDRTKQSGDCGHILIDKQGWFELLRVPKRNAVHASARRLQS